MSEDVEEVVEDQEAAEVPVLDLRALLAQRVETKIRRIHRQWFCLDPGIQAELDAATASLAEMVGVELVKQQGQAKRSGKYSAPLAIRRAEEHRNQLVARSRQVGAMAVLQNLTEPQIAAVDAIKEGGFPKAKAILTQAFLYWETADGERIPDEQFGAEDFATLLEPEVLEQGEWLPLASTIYKQSASVVDRPTLPQS
jgi:hypothetical protein